MDTSTWICANCDRPGGKLEEPQEWLGRLVCAECHTRLSQQVGSNTLQPPLLPPPPPKSRRWTRGTAGNALFVIAIIGAVVSVLCLAGGMQEETKATTVFQEMAARIMIAAAAVVFSVSCLTIGLANALNLIHQQLRMTNEANTGRHQ